MSYAGKAGRGERAARSAGRAAAPARLTEAHQQSAQRGTAARALSLRTASARQMPGNTPEAEVDWQRIAIFAAGIALGLTVGTGATLLLAPRSGEETRSVLARRGRRLRNHTVDAWEDLRDDLRSAARRGRRKLAGAVRRVRHRDDEEAFNPPPRRRAVS